MVNGAVTLISDCGGNDTDIVDQPGRADHRGGDQPHFSRRRVERFKRRGINQGELVDAVEARVRKLPLGIVERRFDGLATKNCLAS